MLTCLLFLFFQAGLLFGQNFSPERPLIVKKNLVYKSVDSLSLPASLFIPDTSKALNRLLVILPDETLEGHEAYESLATLLADSGYTSMIIDYRQPPDFSHPAPSNDIIDAIAWLKANQNRFNLDIQAVGLIGQNFGGYLASMVGLTRKAEIQAVVAMHSPMDLTTYIPPWGYPYRYHVLAGQPLKADRKIWESLSPVSHAEKSSPPLLLLHGTDDRRVPVSQSLEMKRILTQRLGRVRLIQAEGGKNGYFMADSNIAATGTTILNFFSGAMINIPDSIEWLKDLPYAAAGEKTLKADIMKPKTYRGKLPAVLLFHGGGWMWGRKEDMTQYAVDLARNGYAAITVEYRLAREALYPAAFDDAKAAVRWVKSVADTLEIDPERIGAAGQSAGGHLAALLGVTNEKNFIGQFIGRREYSSAIKAAATFSGVVDMLSLYPRDPFSPAALFGGSPESNRKAYLEASPISHISKTSSSFLFIHGAKDHLGLAREMEDMAAKLNHLGVEAETLIIEGGGHNFERYPEFRALGVQKLLEFMDRNLKTINGSNR